MKKLFALLVILVLIFASCSTEQPAVKTTESNLVPQLPLSHYTNMWEGANKRMGDTHVLFHYDSISEAATTLSIKVASLEPDMRQEIDSVAGAVQIVSRIRVGDGKAVLTDYHFMNNKDEIISSFEFDDDEGQFVESSNPGPALVAAFGICPEGFTSLGFCFYGDGFGDCMGTTQQTFTSASLQEEGSYMYLYVAVGGAGMQTCGKAGKL